MDSASHHEGAGGAKAAQRRHLLALRQQFVASAGFAAAAESLARHLTDVLDQLEPACLGLFWPVRSEFNAAGAVGADSRLADLALALPFVRREPREMHYRRWNRAPPTLRDDAGIPTSDGAPVVPDVLVVPCVGFTAAAYRLGYGGGYFDRWLAAHPQVTTVGVAWSFAQIAATEFAAEAHDKPLDVVVTEHGVAS